METSRIVLDFSKLSDANLETKAQAIVAAMTGNANFTTPSPTLTVVTTAITTYSTALSAAATRDRTSIAIKNDAREALTETLKALAGYVAFTSAGDRTKLVSSGFTLAKDRVPAPGITKPENMEAVNGINLGEMNVSVTGVPNARSYVHQYTTDPMTANSTWNSTSTTKCKHTFESLPQGQKLWFRIAAVGSKGQVAYGDVVSRVVQ